MDRTPADERSDDALSHGAATRGAPLRADAPAQLALLDVQTFDARLDRLDHRRRTLSETTRLEELSAQRAELSTRLALARTAVDDLSAEVQKAEADVAQVRSRRQRDQQRLDGGAVGSPRELEQLQHEIVSLDRRATVLEDAELEVMEQLEGAQSTLAGTETELAGLDAELETVGAGRDEAVADLDRQGALARSERDRTAATLPQELLALYEKVRSQQGGVGAAVLRQGRCEGCRLELNAADLRDIALATADMVLRCPECNRLLVRTSESGL